MPSSFGCWSSLAANFIWLDEPFTPEPQEIPYEDQSVPDDYSLIWQVWLTEIERREAEKDQEIMMRERDLGTGAEAERGIGEETETAPTTMIETENMAVTETVSGAGIVIEGCVGASMKMLSSFGISQTSFVSCLHGLLVCHLLEVASPLSNSYV